MKKITTAILCLLAMSISAYAQRDIVKSLQTDVAGQGKVTIHQDAKISTLLMGGSTSTTVKAGEKKELKRQGYRVQVYAGNNTSRSRNEAQQMASRVKQHFQDAQVYAYFVSPRWLCRVGNYPSIEEADAMMRQLKSTGVFKEVSIVRDQITIDLN
ncbi:MAG: SPOR domain-containing protein [Bacteroidaceae bacterium]|nr:SPOR domain-containing protein [Bacteroidaceae bacterium]